MTILGIETSCDETAAAVVCDGRRVLSHVVHSQAALHRPYGGVVPEIASRSHVTVLPDILAAAVREAGLGYAGLDTVAVTYGPGLASSLLVGLAAAKALALRLGRPLVAINHLEAHMFSAFLDEASPPVADCVPFVALAISGGHTSLVRVEGVGRYTLLGQTIDDAAGEAFDKGANLLGLGYPGGPAIDRVSRGANAAAVRFPRGRQRSDRMPFEGLDPARCFSFSGVKTALLYHLRARPPSGPAEVADVAASYQEAILDAVVERCAEVMRGERCLSVGGGVSLNSRLRSKLQELAARRGFRLLLTPPRYCGDNGAMIAALAALGGGLCGAEAWAADATPNLPVALPPAG